MVLIGRDIAREGEYWKCSVVFQNVPRDDLVIQVWDLQLSVIGATGDRSPGARSAFPVGESSLDPDAPPPPPTHRDRTPGAPAPAPRRYLVPEARQVQDAVRCSCNFFGTVVNQPGSASEVAVMFRYADVLHVGSLLPRPAPRPTYPLLPRRISSLRTPVRGELAAGVGGQCSRVAPRA